MSARLRPEWSKTLENSPGLSKNEWTNGVSDVSSTHGPGRITGSDQVTGRIDSGRTSGQVTGRTSGRTLKIGRGRRPARDGDAPDFWLRVDGAWVHSPTSNGA
ncbi:hypothetical protein LWI28_007228 [Acer negundo]|uniref:Uncharacterized protein n=1 Tax=Acer negundo TaxID=4023 RepID=A0AAD5J8N5_ACENE|nr:hypothetical protein LWI28_007228 [Acer negundo]